MSLTSLSSSPTHDEILAAFKQYAVAYGLIESIQNPDAAPQEVTRLLPTGDQKTGCIGEYWAMRFARKRFGQDKCRFGNHSQHGWDIAIQGSRTRIQIKTVSEWSKSRALSPIHAQKERPEKAPDDWAPWTDLWLIHLNKDLFPTGFWQLKREHVDFGGRDKLAGLKIRRPANHSSGSECLTWPENTVGDLLDD